jgi:hypothetical protein
MESKYLIFSVNEINVYVVHGTQQHTLMRLKLTYVSRAKTIIFGLVGDGGIQLFPRHVHFSSNYQHFFFISQINYFGQHFYAVRLTRAFNRNL